MGEPPASASRTAWVISATLLVFQQIACRTGADGLEDFVVVLEDGEDDDERLGVRS
jgi:hypothetical protein